MQDALEQYIHTLGRLTSLSTETSPLVFTRIKSGTVISIGNEKFYSGGNVIIPMEMVEAYAYLKMALQVNKAKEPFKF